MQTAFAGLVAELFYRFVWARHTHKAHMYLQQKTTRNPSSHSEIHKQIDFINKDNEIIDQEDLGEGTFLSE
jgi:hypothetical protein